MQFISNITATLNQRSDDMTVSAVTGGCGAAKQDGNSLFTNVHTSQDVNKHLETISTPSFNYIMRQMRLKLSGRKNRKVGLLFLDKTLQKREYSKSKRETKYATFQGVDVFVIGVGHRVSDNQGQNLTSSREDYFHVSNYETLYTIEEKVSCVI